MKAKIEYRVEYTATKTEMIRTGLMSKKNAELIADQLKGNFKNVRVYKDEDNG